mgnify:CR=1 FL=1
MTLTLPDAILAESFFKVTVGIGGQITTEQLTLLENHVADDVKNFIGIRTITDDTKTRITACFILDIYANKGGKGTIVQETVTDASWKSQIKTSSQYMDRAYSLRDNVDSNKCKFASAGITREDAPVTMNRDENIPRFLFG